MIKSRLNLKIDYCFLSILAAVIFINLRYFSPNFYPQHDTLSVFEHFYFFYNEFYFHHILAQWLPYGVYGIPGAEAQISSFSPVDYLMFVLGKIFAIQDVLCLFKIGMILKQSIFVSGLYFLSRLFFNRRAVVAFVCLSALCSLDWSYQIFFNFKIYDYLPWVFYFLVLFFQRQKSFYLWISATVGVIWALGSGVYFAPLWFFVFFLIATVLLISQKEALRALMPQSSKDFLSFAIFTGVLASYLFFLIHAFDSINIATRSNAQNTIDIFAHYGRNPTYANIVKWLFFGVPTYTNIGTGFDNTVYPTLAASFFFIWAMLYNRNQYSLSIGLAVLVLILITMGGWLTHLVYYFPGMKYFRHVGLILPLIKLLIILGAGFGLADLLNSASKVRLKKFLICFGVSLLLIYSSLEASSVVFMLIHSGVWSHLLTSADYSNIQYRFLGYAIALVMILIARGDYRWLLVSIFLSLGVDSFFYQEALAKKMPHLPKTSVHLLKATNVHELEYVLQRAGEASNEHQRLSLLLEKELRQAALAHYDDTFWGFAQMDPRFGQLNKAVLVNQYVRKLLDSSLSADMRDSLTGIGQPKLQLLSLEDQMKVSKFNANELVAHVNIQQEEGSWLIYADGYHPGWKAYINHVPTDVLRANIAFKSVFLPKGEYELRLEYWNGFMSFLSYFLAFLGILWAIAILGLISLRALFSIEFNLETKII